MTNEISLVRLPIWFGLCGLMLLCAGCLSFLATVMPDPDLKTDRAAEILGEGYAINAEDLIVDSMASYEKSNDLLGLGTAHQYYAIFLTSPAVTKSAKYYRRRGFMDESVTFDNRLTKGSEYYAKSLEYFQLAERQQLDASRYDDLARVYFNTAVTYHRLMDREKTCEFLKRSTDAEQENTRRNDGKPREWFNKRLEAFKKGCK